MDKKQILAVLAFIILLAAIPITMYLIKQQQIFKSKAAFIPKVEFLDASGNVLTQTSSRNVRLRIRRESVTASPSPNTSFDMNVLVIKYFPLTASGKLNSATTQTSCLGDQIFNSVGNDCDLTTMRNWVDKLTNDGISILGKASVYKGYQDTNALPYFKHKIVASKEYLEAVPLTFNILDGDPNSGKWSPRSGFVGDYLQIDTGKSSSFDRFTLYFWSQDRPEKFHIDISDTGKFNGEEKRAVSESDGLSGYAKINPDSPIERKTYNFGAISGRYIQLTIDAWRAGDPQGNNAQINLYELDAGSDLKGSLEYSPSAAGYSNKFAYLNKEDVCNYVDNKGVKEVWLWMYHSSTITPLESNMAMGRESQANWNRSSYGDVSNSDKINDLPVCQKTYTVYEFNYARGLGEMMEDFGHQLEQIFHFVDDSDNKKAGDDGLFWKRWVGSEYKDFRILNPGCGWTHFAPNGAADYDWYNESPVLSDCEGWKPDGGGTKKAVNCHTWSGSSCTVDGGVAWKTWWMQNIPGRNNDLTFQGKKLRNWWEFYVDFDDALKKGKSLFLTQ